MLILQWPNHGAFFLLADSIKIFQYIPICNASVKILDFQSEIQIGAFINQVGTGVLAHGIHVYCKNLGNDQTIV